MSSISEAVILMAGSGSRLRASNGVLPKPLTPILGRPMISYTIDALAAAGITVVNAVVGFESASLIAGFERLLPPGMELRVINNLEWQKQNGISLLAAANYVNEPFLLTMGDHLFDESIVNLLVNTAENDRLHLAVDRKLDSILDLDDAMKVKTRGDQIIAIGKDLISYDAIDTGLFVCPPGIFKYLENAKRNGDCSLADGVRLMAAAGKARVIDIGPAWWQDIDTPQMLQRAISVLGSVGSTLAEPRKRSGQSYGEPVIKNISR
jgi:1L-myo-inositol 1-phosphate cytidylyltransferase